ncbi:MAG: hypothetical protein QXR60_05270 [Candidatus Nanoarchaeia archaeon]
MLPELVAKLKSFINKKQVASITPKVSPEEFELRIYKEKERQERIKAEVSRYRKLDAKKMFEDTILKQKPTLMTKDNGLKQKKRIMTGKNFFIK